MVTFKIVNGDIVSSAANGQPTMVTGQTLLSQDILEFFTINVTPQGFGAGLEQLVGLVAIDTNTFVGLIDNRIRSGIQQLISIQNQDSRIKYQPNELVLSLANLQAAQNPTDPTGYYFAVSIITQAGVVFTVPVTLPL